LAAAKAGQWSRTDDGNVEVAGQVLTPDEYELRFRAAEGLDAVPFAGMAGVVVLDTDPDDELLREGVARDFIRLVQVARKDAGFDVSDRIRIQVKTGGEARAAIDAHLDTVKRETLANTVEQTEGTPAGFTSDATLASEPVTIGVEVAG